MANAFGVDDNRVSKSKIPGGPWKKVTDLTSAERILVRRGKPHTPFKPSEEMPKGNIPKQAYTKGKGNVRVTEFDRGGAFSITNRDEKIYRSRDAYKFKKAFLPGGVSKPLSAMTGTERKTWKAGVKGGKLSSSLKGATARDTEVKEALTNNTQAVKGLLSVVPHAEKKHAGGTVKLVRSKDSGMPTAWVPSGSKGGQRRNKGVVFHGQMQDKNSFFGGMRDIPKEHSGSYMKHELTHAKRRKPMSAMARFMRKPEKLWGDEARADSVMSRDTRAISGYRQVASSDKEGQKHLLSNMRGNYQNEKGPERYKQVSQKLGTWEESAHRIQGGKQKSTGTKVSSAGDKKPYWNSDRKWAAAETAAGITGGTAGVALAIKSQKKEKARRTDAHNRAVATRRANLSNKERS